MIATGGSSFGLEVAVRVIWPKTLKLKARGALHVYSAVRIHVPDRGL